MATGRVRKYHVKLKNDPENEQKVRLAKKKKKVENNAYKSKLQLRKTNEDCDKAFKTQKKWKQESIKRKQKTTNKVVNQTKNREIVIVWLQLFP